MAEQAEDPPEQIIVITPPLSRKPLDRAGAATFVKHGCKVRNHKTCCECIFPPGTIRIAQLRIHYPRYLLRLPDRFEAVQQVVKPGDRSILCY
jgi:hypothetical protein